MTLNPTHAGAIPGAGIDADFSQRPGVPMEKDPPEPVGGAHWGEPIRQPDPGYILKRSDLARLTPVFGTSIPPRGISGLVRRMAYAVPEHRAMHWMMLLLADRIDVLEHRAIRLSPVLVPLLVGGGALVYMARRRRSLFQRLMCRLS
jgi:hypothetical protein